MPHGVGLVHALVAVLGVRRFVRLLHDRKFPDEHAGLNGDAAATAAAAR